MFKKDKSNDWMSLLRDIMLGLGSVEINEKAFDRLSDGSIATESFVTLHTSCITTYTKETKESARKQIFFAFYNRICKIKEEMEKVIAEKEKEKENESTKDNGQN